MFSAGAFVIHLAFANFFFQIYPFTSSSVNCSSPIISNELHGSSEINLSLTFFGRTWNLRILLPTDHCSFLNDLVVIAPLQPHVNVLRNSYLLSHLEGSRRSLFRLN